MEVRQYLRIDSTRVPLADYWRWKPGLPFLSLATRKLLRLPLRAAILVPAEPGLIVVRDEEAPAALREALQPAIDVCRTNGRTLEFLYRAPTVGRIATLAAALVDAERLSVTVAAIAQSGARHKVTLGLLSRVHDGKFLATGVGDTFLSPPPELEMLRLVGRPAAELIARHDERVLDRRAQVIPVSDVRALILDIQRCQIEANLARGIYVPASAEDLRRFT